MLLYILSILFFPFQCDPSLTFWAFMEFHLACFLLVVVLDMWKTDLKVVYDICLLYVFIQPLGSVLYFLSIFFENSNFSVLLFILSVYLKMAIFPLLFWSSPYLSSSLSPKIYLSLLMLQKLPMLSVLFTLEPYPLNFLCFFICLVIGRWLHRRVYS